MDYWDGPEMAGPNVFNLTSGTATPDQYLATDGTRLADDVVLTNVIGFDVKAWDPGAPVRSFQDPATNQPVIVKPGDARYAEAIRNHAPIIAYGAYVDLGWYMYDSGYPDRGDPAIPPTNGAQAPAPHFWNYGSALSGLTVAGQLTQCVYDTYSFSYENEGIYYFDNAGTAHAVPYNSSKYPAGLGKWPAGTSTNGLDDDGDGIIDGASELITQPPYPVALRGIQVKIRCYEPDSRQIREITIVHDFLPE